MTLRFYQGFLHQRCPCQIDLCSNVPGLQLNNSGQDVPRPVDILLAEQAATVVVELLKNDRGGRGKGKGLETNSRPTGTVAWSSATLMTGRSGNRCVRKAPLVFVNVLVDVCGVIGFPAASEDPRCQPVVELAIRKHRLDRDLIVYIVVTSFFDM